MLLLEEKKMNDELPFSLCFGIVYTTTTRKPSCSVRVGITMTGYLLVFLVILLQIVMSKH